MLHSSWRWTWVCPLTSFCPHWTAWSRNPEPQPPTRPPSAPPNEPQDWTALSVDSSYIDVDRRLSLRCHLIQPGPLCHHLRRPGYGCQLFSEPTPAVEDEDLHLHSPDGARRNPDLRPAAQRTAHRGEIRAPVVVALRMISCRTFPSCPTRLKPWWS